MKTGNTPLNTESVNGKEPLTTSPAMDLINFSSSSGEEFAVEPFTMAQLENRFRVVPFALTASMEATEAISFSNNGEAGTDDREQHIDTRGSIIQID